MAVGRLLGETIDVGARSSGRVTGVLADPSGRPVLLRVRLSPSGEIGYVPGAAVERSAGGGISHRAPILLRREQAAFYEQRGLEWVCTGEVSNGIQRGIVRTGDDG